MEGTYELCKKGLWLLQSGRKEEEYLLPVWHLSWSLALSKDSPSKVPLLAARGKHSTDTSADTQMFRAGRTGILGATFEATAEAQEDSAHLYPLHNYISSLRIADI